MLVFIFTRLACIVWAHIKIQLRHSVPYVRTLRGVSGKGGGGGAMIRTGTTVYRTVVRLIDVECRYTRWVIYICIEFKEVWVVWIHFKENEQFSHIEESSCFKRNLHVNIFTSSRLLNGLFFLKQQWYYEFSQNQFNCMG